MAAPKTRLGPHALPAARLAATTSGPPDLAGSATLTLTATGTLSTDGLGADPVLIAPDHQDLWAPCWLLDVAVTERTWAQADLFQASMIQRGLPASTLATFATVDGILLEGDVYHGRLIDSPVVNERLTETAFGQVSVSDATVRLANADHAIDHLYTANLLGVTMRLRRYDRLTATLVDVFVGRITDQQMGEGDIVLSGSSPDEFTFTDELPRGVVTVGLFGARAVDLGATIPVIFGNAKRVRCPYVNDNTVADEYDYVVGHGALTVQALYRDAITAGSDELELIDPTTYVVETTRYPGYTTIRFTAETAGDAARQEDHDGNLHNLFASASSPTRNFATAAKEILSNATWGMGLAVHAASFATAETALTAIGSLFCDGALDQPRQAQDVLADVLMVRGMRLGWNTSGECTIAVDTQPSEIRLHVRDGAGDGERTLLAITQRRRRYAGDGPARIRLRFRVEHAVRGRERLEVSRTIHAGAGGDVVIEHPLIRNATTADKVVDYLAKKAMYRQETIGVEIAQQARKLVPGELVLLTSAAVGFSAQTMVVVDTVKDTERVGATLRTWDKRIYEYTPEPLPQGIPATVPRIPSPPTNVVASTRTGGIRLTWTRITGPFEHVEVWRAETNTRAAAVLVDETASPTSYLDSSEDLKSGATYYYWLRRVAPGGRFSAFHTGDTDGTAGTAPMIVGYLRVGSGTPFSGAGAGALGVAVDTLAGNLDVVQVRTADADLYWGESTRAGKQKTALASKAVGTFARVAAAFDGADVQMVLTHPTDGTIKYGRLSNAGAAEQSPTNIYAGGDASASAVALAFGGDTLFAAWVTTSLTVRVARMDKLGAIADQLTLFTETDATSIETLALGVDPDGNLHVVTQDVHTGTNVARLRYRKLSPLGLELVAATTLASRTTTTEGTLAALLCRADTSGQMVVLAAADPVASGSRELLLSIVSSTGVVLLAPRTLLSFTDEAAADLGAAELDPTTNALYYLYPAASGDVKFERFARVG